MYHQHQHFSSMIGKAIIEKFRTLKGSNKIISFTRVQGYAKTESGLPDQRSNSGCYSLKSFVNGRILTNALRLVSKINFLFQKSAVVA